MPFYRRTFSAEKQLPAGNASAGLSFWRWIKRVTYVAGLVLCSVLTVFLLKWSYPAHRAALLAWVALVPFIIGLLSLRTFWQSFWYSWLTGTAIYGTLYYWVFVTCYEGGGLSVGLSAAAWLGLSVLMALQFAIFGVSCYLFKDVEGFFPLLAACGWAVLEWGHELFASYFIGFPWFSLSYSQWNFPAVLQVAAWGGAVSLSFLIVFVSVSIAYGLYIPSLKKGVGHFIWAFGIFLIVFYSGKTYIENPPKTGLLHLKAVVMQPNIDQYKKWTAQFEEEIKETMDLLAEQTLGKEPLLMVWPESVTPGAVQEEPYKEWMEQIAQKTGAWQVVGSNREKNGRQYVSAFMLSAQGKELGFYDKTHLVPFGEFIPLEKQLRALFPQIEVLGELGSFSAGAWEQPLIQFEQMPVGSTICYESVFSHLWREQSRSGARFFVNLTNDAWFFNTDAPYQHLAAVVLRAVENRRTVLRAANTGISAVIAPTGEILARAELDTRAVLFADVTLPLGEELSVYNQWPNWFAWLCVVIYLTSLLSVLIFSSNE